MRFKDLPHLFEIKSVYDTYYEHAIPHTVFLHIVNSGFISFDSLSKAYECLKNEPDGEVDDTFYGKNLPFLCGSQFYMNNFIGSTIIIELRADDYMASVCDHTYTSNKELTDFVEQSVKNDLYISCSGKHYFATRTHQEIMDRVGVARLIES